MRKRYQKEARGTGRESNSSIYAWIFLFISQDELDFWSALPLASFLFHPLLFQGESTLGGPGILGTMYFNVTLLHFFPSHFSLAVFSLSDC